jgi:hypothetical protein
MKWELASASSGNEVYSLYKEDKKVLTVTINPFSHTARVDCEKQKRVFLIRKEGLLRNKTVIRSEYGIKIGELGQENGKAYIDVNDERVFYTTKNNPLAELVLYKGSPSEPLVSCGLKTEDDKAGISFKKESSLSSTSHPGLLMGLCWYMFLPVARENVVAYAV